jgi:hypothetical protein
LVVSGWLGGALVSRRRKPAAAVRTAAVKKARLRAGLSQPAMESLSGGGDAGELVARGGVV